jgi:hypothetical protein
MWIALWIFLGLSGGSFGEAKTLPGPAGSIASSNASGGGEELGPRN